MSWVKCNTVCIEFQMSLGGIALSLSHTSLLFLGLSPTSPKSRSEKYLWCILCPAFISDFYLFIFWEWSTLFSAVILRLFILALSAALSLQVRLKRHKVNLNRSKHERSNNINTVLRYRPLKTLSFLSFFISLKKKNTVIFLALCCLWGELQLCLE